MSQPGQPGPQDHRTDDLAWAMRAAEISRSCYICRRPNAGSSMVLGANSAQGGTRVPRCAQGVGCRDGRIHHGPPQGGSHWPGEDCEVCARESAGRRIADNAAKQLDQRTNRNLWHP